MHPEVKLPEPGKCPICHMDLTPMEAGVEEAGERRLSMSEAAEALADDPPAAAWAAEFDEVHDLVPPGDEGDRRRDGWASTGLDMEEAG